MEIVVECSQCNCLIKSIGLDGGYYIEGSLHPRRSSLHTLKCLDTKNNTIKQGYMRVNKGFVLEIYDGAHRGMMAHTHSIQHIHCAYCRDIATDGGYSKRLLHGAADPSRSSRG